MSCQPNVGIRYARALFEAARDKQQVVEVADGLKLAVSALGANDDFRLIWEHPSIAAADKKAMVQEAFEGKVPELVLNTILLMVDKGRESIMAALLASYNEIADEATGQAEAIVYSPAALTAEEAGQVAATFGAITGKKIRVENIVKPGLLGGLQVRIGDKLYDGSLAGKLQRLEKTLSQQAL